MDTQMDLKGLERVYKALANRRRLAILRYLKKNPGASVGVIASTILVSLKATSKHLIILAAAGLVEREQVSLNMHYRIASNLSVLAKAGIDAI
jgi:DNA-binding transcriptional ArsR family regulator